MSILRQTDVRGLEIAMDDAALVRGLEPLGHLPHDVDRFVESDGSTRQPFVQTFAFDQFQPNRQAPLRFFQSVDRRDVRMISAARICASRRNLTSR